MRNVKRKLRWVAMAMCLILVLQTAACGTLIHPERRGQTGGRIDPAIAVLDGLGLLLFVIPGLVAFAIDFSTGAIYLPGTDTAALPDGNDGATQPRAVHVDPETLDAETIARVIREETGLAVDFDDERVEAYRYENRNLLLFEMANANRDVAEGRVMARLLAP